MSAPANSVTETVACNDDDATSIPAAIESQTGVSEADAYENFGKRCSLRQYVRLTALLNQNMKKGSNNLLVSLQQESRDAFETRKNMARRLGEEAGTKVLGPMMLMLGVVLVMIMIPAYLSFGM